MMKQNTQTPQKQLPRSVDAANRRSKETPPKRIESHEPARKSHKIVAKSLNPSLLAVSEESSPTDKECVDSSFESEEIKLNEPSELPISFDASDLSPALSTVEDPKENDEVGADLIEFGSGCSKQENVSVRVVMDFLGEAQFKISKSSDVDLRSKKILDAMIKVLIEDLYGYRDEGDRFSASVLVKVRIGLFCLLLCVVSISVLLSWMSGGSSSFAGPLPT